MLTGLKVSSLVCKCIFYRSEHNAMGDCMKLNCEGLEIQKWNIPMNRAEKLDEKNGVTCLVTMFAAAVMVFEMSKNGLFFVFSADNSKILVTVWARYLSAPREYIEFFQKMV